MAGPWEDSHQTSHDPRGVQRGKSGSLGVRGKRVTRGFGWVGGRGGEGLRAPTSSRLVGTNLGELGASMTGLESKFGSQNIIRTHCVCVCVEGVEAHTRKGTLERGGMRIYLASHLARGRRRLRILTLAPRSLARWLAGLWGQDVGRWDRRTDGKDLHASGSVSKLNQYGPCGSISKEEDIGFAWFWLFGSCGRSGHGGHHVAAVAQRAVESQRRPPLLQPPRVQAAENCNSDTTQSPVCCFLTECYKKRR